MTSVIHAYQYLWEQDYVVVNWDQRVSGKTYFLNKKNAYNLAQQISIDVLLTDLMANYIRTLAETAHNNSDIDAIDDCVFHINQNNGIASIWGMLS